jgi:hypothetical protein
LERSAEEDICILSTAEIVNRILDKLRTGRVEFLEINSSLGVVSFLYGGVEYTANFESKPITIYRDILQTDHYTAWLEGILNGKTRDADGVLS